MPQNSTEEKRVLLAERGRVFIYLFLIAMIALAVMTAMFACLAAQRKAEQGRAAELEQRLKQLELDGQARLEALQGTLAEREAALEENRAALEQARAALEQAQSTISRLEQYTLLSPDGNPPEYTRLYPEMYARPWEGEAEPEGRTVYLTFDDGPSANTDRILKILDEYGVKGTFFIVGKTDEASQRRMRDIVAAGHTLAVHSWSHSYKRIYASLEAFLEDFHQLYTWIYEVTGSYPQVFRFPGGSLNSYNRGVYQEIISEMLRRGFVFFDWNASAQDATATPLDPSVIRDNCLKGIGREQVVVLTHDSSARGTTVDALPAVIEGYRAAGYAFAPLTPGVTPVVMSYAAVK